MSRQTDIAYQYIKQKILEGEYKPSQKLTEIQLAELIEVSRSTIKKALLKLQQENLVTIENNKGASIKSFTLEEVMNYLEIREVLEGLVARSVAKKISEFELEKLKNILDEMKVRLQSNKLDEYSILNKSFHKEMYKAAKNVQAVELINMIRTQLIRYQFRTILVPGRNQASYEEHEKIYEALKLRDETAAEEAVRNHIVNVRETINNNYQYLL
jgi:DNA-binding GntR family transcriptional regulator